MIAGTGIIYSLKYFSNSSNLLSCNLSEYNSTFKANITTNIDMKFDNDNLINTISAVISYKFDSTSEYDSWKQAFNSNHQLSGILGMQTTNEFDDNNLTIKSIVNQKYSEILQSNLNENLPTDLNEMKKHFLNLGYTCNGEQGTKRDKDNATNDNQNNNGKGIENGSLGFEPLDTLKSIFDSAQFVEKDNKYYFRLNFPNLDENLGLKGNIRVIDDDSLSGGWGQAIFEEKIGIHEIDSLDTALFKITEVKRWVISITIYDKEKSTDNNWVTVASAELIINLNNKRNSTIEVFPKAIVGEDLKDIITYDASHIFQ
jgi:hypothetical protein